MDHLHRHSPSTCRCLRRLAIGFASLSFVLTSATSYARTDGIQTLIGAFVLLPSAVIAVQSILLVWLFGVSVWRAMGTSALATVVSIMFAVLFVVLHLLGPGGTSFPLSNTALVLTVLLANTGVIVWLHGSRSRRTVLRLLGVQAGLVSVCLFVLPPLIMRSSYRSPIARAKCDMRSMATGLESYYADHDAYPTTFPLAAMLSPGERDDLRKAGGIDLGAPANLTTPVAYVTALFPDPYRPGRRLPYGYHADAKLILFRGPDNKLPFAYHADTNGFVLFSPGPDGKYDIVPQVDYTSTIPQPSPQLLLKCYDPTNGTCSPGDVMRVKQ